jgi:hypothetical protein
VVDEGKNVRRCSSKDLSSVKGSFGAGFVVGFDLPAGVVVVEICLGGRGEVVVDDFGSVWGTVEEDLIEAEAWVGDVGEEVLSFRKSISRNSGDNEACRLLCSSNISSSLISSIFILFSLSISSINSFPSNIFPEDSSSCQEGIP